MPAAVKTAFHVAFWFVDRARSAGAHLQPQRLQNLLVLAQGCFAARYGGRALMPAVFVADPRGPVEPNVAAAFSDGPPALQLEPWRHDEAVTTLLEAVWRRFGDLGTQRLSEIIADLPAYRIAIDEGEGTPIPLPALARSCLDSGILGRGVLAGHRILRTQTGRPVSVCPWTPGDLAGAARRQTPRGEPRQALPTT